jgi:hypothetical protein
MKVMFFFFYGRTPKSPKTKSSETKLGPKMLEQFPRIKIRFGEDKYIICDCSHDFSSM